MTRLLWIVLFTLVAPCGYAAQRSLPELMRQIDSTLTTTSLGDEAEYFTISFDTPPSGVELLWEEVEMLGVPLLGVEYERFCVAGRYLSPEGVTSLLVVSNTGQEMFADLVNFDASSNRTGCRRVAYSCLADDRVRTESRIEGGYLFTTEWRADGGVSLVGCKIGQDGGFADCEYVPTDVYPLRNGYAFCQSYCYTDEGTEYLLALCSPDDSWVVDSGSSPSQSRHIPRYAGVDTETYLGVVTWADSCWPVLALYDKTTHDDLLKGDCGLLCDFHDDSGLLLYYLVDSERNPDDCLTLFDLNSGKSMQISPDDFISDPNRTLPCWWMPFKIEQVDRTQVGLLYDGEKPVRRSYRRI